MRIDERVLVHVASSTRFGPVTWLEEVDSTNRWAADAVRRGEQGELVVVADHQTAGRGRLDRRWDAPPGGALLASVVLRPEGLPAERRHLLTALIALAARDACEALGGFAPDIKWPNDLLVGDRKLAGILAMVVDGSAVDGSAVDGSVVVGIGLNLTSAPDGAVAAADVALRPFGRDDLLGGLLDAVDRRYGRWDVLAADYAASCATVGRRVRVDGLSGTSLTGTAEGVDDRGQLIVAVDGRVAPVAVSAADVVHLRPAGDDGW
jgi:BirA family transcriptional regulator, biotin operon repressor / biotin---[acetyl-CoA-carboxylase] ligase